MRKIVFPIVVLFFVLTSPLLADSAKALSSIQVEAELEASVSDFVNTVDIRGVREHVSFFSSLTTRATGYLGNEIATQYISDFFMNLTLPPYSMENVSFHEFTVADCIDLGANITVLSTGDVLKIFPLLPNFVCPSTTPPEGITGKLVYAGEGRTEDFDGLQVEGSIVLMDWNSVNRWLNAVKLGAKAVVFIRSLVHLTSLTGSQYVKWLRGVPLNFPRFYADDAATTLLQGHLGEEVKIVSTQQWKSMTGKNILGFVKGTQSPDQYVVLSSYYDSYSVAPSVAPGAQEACGISALLELARYLSQNPPKYSVIFVAYGGHSQFLSGAINFAHDYQAAPKFSEGLVTPETQIGDRIILQVNLDFATGSKVPYITNLGGGFRRPAYIFEAVYMPLWQYTKDLINELQTYEVRLAYGLGEWAGMDFDKIEGHTDAEILSWKEFPYDSEALAKIKRSRAICIATAYDSRPYYWEPFDTIDKLNFDNLKVQLEFTHVLLLRLLNDANLYTLVSGGQTPYPREDTDTVRFCKIVGTVSFWNTTKNFYDPIPNAIVCFEEAPLHPETCQPIAETRWINYFWYRQFAIADENGEFSFIPPNSAYHYADLDYRVQGWVINQTTGGVIYAPDFGISMWPEPSETLPPVFDWGFVTVFEASTIGFFDIMSPDALKLPTWSGEEMYPDVLAFEFENHMFSKSWSSWMYATASSSVLVVAIPPETPAEIMLRDRLERYPLALLLNTNPENPMGQGYAVPRGEQTILPFTSMHYAENLYWLNEARLDAVQEYLPSLEPYFEESRLIRDMLDEAWDKIADFEYSKAQALSIEAWARSLRLYNNVRPAIEDTAFAVPFLSFFLIPFTLLAERLLFKHGGMKRVASFMGVFIALLASYFLIHPGFSVAASPPMIVMGFTFLLLVVPLLAIISQYVTGLMREIRTERMGKHEAEISRTSELIQSFVIGVGHMRRTRLRTTLTIVSIILMVAGMISIVSISKIEVLQTPTVPGHPEFEGIYFHKVLFGQGRYEMGEPLVEYLNAKYGDQATIVPEAWRLNSYAEIPNDYRLFNGDDSRTGFRVEKNGEVVIGELLVGLTPQQDDFGAYAIALTAGRWFVSTDRKALILNEIQAETLGISVEDIETGVESGVLFEGEEFKVVGIISTDIHQVLTLDGRRVTPVKYDVTPNFWYTHSSPEEFLILPYETVIAMGGDIASISIIFENPDLIPQVARELVNLPITYEIFTCRNEQIRRYSREGLITTWGFQQQVVPMVIVILTVFNILLGSVYERRGEIATYGTIGLSPLHISLMFLAETASYAVVGGVIGYLSSLVFAKVATLILPGAILANYSSSTVIMALAGSMGATILSSTYPIFVASRMITPSLERKWKIPTKPVGDLWEIPLPFFAASDQEARGIMKYMNEYLEAHRTSDAPHFYVLDMKSSEGTTERGEAYKDVTANMRLAPYENGVIHMSTISLVKAAGEEERWRCFLVLRRNMGTRDDWVMLGRNYVDTLRKQLLLWRSLKPDERERYLKEA